MNASPFTDVLCGVEASEESLEAARQAVTLASGGRVRFIAVATSFHLGENVAKENLEKTLTRCAELAREAGVEPSTEMREAEHATNVLLPESERHDLLVVGSHGGSRAAGIVTGSTATQLAHDTEGKLLVARIPAAGEFPNRILLASDGAGGSWGPARTAARIAAAFGASLDVVHVADGGSDRRQTIDDQLAEIGEVGVEPNLIELQGDTQDAILNQARSGEASLVVTGRRNLKGIKALGSVSERVVHRAPCSVLLAAPEER